MREQEKDTDRCSHIYNEIPEDIPSQTFQKSLLSFLSQSRSRLECRIKKKSDNTHTHPMYQDKHKY